jgi:hypothetical protein
VLKEVTAPLPVLASLGSILLSKTDFHFGNEAFYITSSWLCMMRGSNDIHFMA